MISLPKANQTFMQSSFFNQFLPQNKASEFELGLLGDAKFSFGKSLLGKTKTFSKGVTVKRVSEDDYKNLLNLDLFRGGDMSDVTDTKLSSATFKKNRKSGQVFQTSGQELSAIDQQGIEKLAQVVAGRQAQLQGAALTPGLDRQSFSLLSGNFS